MLPVAMTCCSQGSNTGSLFLKYRCTVKATCLALPRNNIRTNLLQLKNTSWAGWGAGLEPENREVPDPVRDLDPLCGDPNPFQTRLCDTVCQTWPCRRFSSSDDEGEPDRTEDLDPP